jgi:hypothetical protein
MEDEKVYRVLDANFNRAKEGLRVCEDVCRFVFDDQPLTGQYKDIRHSLTQLLQTVGLKRLVQARNIEHDVGKPSIDSEMKRSDVFEIFDANSQRIKESVRVLEEFIKMIDPKSAQLIKNLRYKVYDCEKEIITRRENLSDS